jgi:uncharacterized membrane protein
MFENPLFIIPFLTGIIFSVAGSIMLRFPPKKINSLYGYRTPSSMKSIERWNFAQEYSSKEIIKLGVILTTCCLFSFLSPFDNFTNMIIGLSLMVVLVIILFWRVEKAIKTKFEKE